MADAMTGLQNFIEFAVFGNGALAFGGLAVVIGVTAVVRLSRGIRV